MSQFLGSQPVAVVRRIAPFVLLVSFAYGGLAQGGYHPQQFVVLLGVIGVAGVGALAAALPLRIGAIVTGAALIASSTLVSAWSAGDLAAALPPLGLLAMIAIVGALVEALDNEGVEVVAAGLRLLGVAVACTALVGVAVRLEPWGRQVDGLWRGSSSLTYSNAAAALIGALLLFTTAHEMAESVDGSSGSRTRPERRRAQAHLAQFVMVVGLLSTQSRAGLAAFLIGTLALAIGSGPLRLARAAVVPGIVGLAVAVVLLSSASNESQSRPMLSLGAVVLGGVVVVATPRVSARLNDLPAGARLLGALVVLLIGAGLVSMVLATSDGSLAEIAERRLTLSSDTASREVILFGDRAHEWSAAADQFRGQPLLGVGPGQLQLRWSLDGKAYRAQFTHNEYLELAATQGIVGLLALTTAFAVTADGIRSRWRSHSRDQRWAIVSALVVLLVHSAFDYLWHIPLVPLVAVTLVALALRRPTIPSQDPNPTVGPSPQF